MASSLLENSQSEEINNGNDLPLNCNITDHSVHKQLNGKYNNHHINLLNGDDDNSFPSIFHEQISKQIDEKTPLLKEKMKMRFPDNDSYERDQEHSWAREVDLFREKLKAQHFSNNAGGNNLDDCCNGFSKSISNNQYQQGNELDFNNRICPPNTYYHHSGTNYRDSSNFVNDNSLLVELDNKFTTRSESEPNNISDLLYSPSAIKISNNFVNEHKSHISKKLPPTPPSKMKFNRNSSQVQEHNVESLDFDNDYSTVYSNKKLPPKVLLYNNNQTPRSPKSSGQKLLPKKPNRILTATTRPSVTRNINDFRRCRTKSPSPTFNRNLNKRLDYDDGYINFKSMRKARSETPSPGPPRTFEEFSNVALSKTKINNTFNTTKETKTFCLPSGKSKLENDDDGEDDESCYDDDEFELSENDDAIESSSDSEEGYGGHAFSKSDKSDESLVSESLATPNNCKEKVEVEFVPMNPESILTPSLFPNVPPYLSFSTNLEKGPEVPPELQKVLKWKLSKVMPKLVRHTLINSGCRILKKTNEWMGTWGKHMKSPCFRTVRPYQKINHLPGSFKIGRKDSCWKNLQKQVIRHGKKEFGFMPKTYIFPNDINILRKTWPKYQQRNIKWIIKPPASARGTGIKVVFAWSQIPKRKPLIVQKYIERPLLINGSKFDLRLYVLVTSINPLRVYIYKDGLARFASVKYSTKSETLHDRCMHLTNYSINKHSSNYAKNEDVNACEGHKWTLKSLMTYLENTGIDIRLLWLTMKNLVLRTLLAGEDRINNMVKLNTGSRYNVFELFGFDILLDSNLVPWLLEVNISPSLHSDLPLDMHVKGPLVQAVLNTALYHVPPKISSTKQKEISAKTGVKGPICYDKRLYVTYLSRTEKIKHNQFTRKDLEDRDEYLDAILENLTPDDVRCLITSEDELAHCLPLERIFPTNKTYKLLKYTEGPRYYNRLLDAWEHRYSENRDAGRKILKDLCETNYHLQVPPAPTQRNIHIRTRTVKISNTSSNAVTTTPSASKIVTPSQQHQQSSGTVIQSIKTRHQQQIHNYCHKVTSSKLTYWTLARAAKKRIIKKNLQQQMLNANQQKEKRQLKKESIVDQVAVNQSSHTQ